MVNYRRVLCEVALISVIAVLANAAPVSDDVDVYYDQKQNGTENTRIFLDGLVIAVVPAEPLFAALGDTDALMELISSENLNKFKLKPPPSTVTLLQEPIGLTFQTEKPQEKPLLESPQETKPEVKLEEIKPEAKPEVPPKVEVSPLSDVSLDDDLKVQKKEISSKKQEKVNRFKNRIEAFLTPLLKKARHME